MLLNCGVGEDFESPLDCKEIQPVHPKGDQSWVSMGRTEAEAKTPVLWPPDVKSWLSGKDPDAGRDWGQEEKGMTEDEMAGWHHRLNGHGYGWTLGVGDRQGGLVCCGSWGCKESDTTERLNWTELKPEKKLIIHFKWLKNSIYAIISYQCFCRFGTEGSTGNLGDWPLVIVRTYLTFFFFFTVAAWGRKKIALFLSVYFVGLLHLKVG